MKTALALTFHGLGHSSYRGEKTIDFAAGRYNVSEKHFSETIKNLDPIVCTTVSVFVG